MQRRTPAEMETPVTLQNSQIRLRQPVADTDSFSTNLRESACTLPRSVHQSEDMRPDGHAHQTGQMVLVGMFAGETALNRKRKPFKYLRSERE